MHSDRATPLVVVPKAGKGVRLCTNFMVAAHPHLDKELYPLPNPQDIYATFFRRKILLYIRFIRGIGIHN